ncbi:Protein of unknown function [Lactobacillus helveticus CIRM-BIA 951]|nr:Protein of unknown function [Lactobacillus helveticus CIRM-BIA 951]
MAFKSI